MGGATPTKGPLLLMAMSAIVRGRPVKAASLYMPAVAFMSLWYSSKELIMSMAYVVARCCCVPAAVCMYVNRQPE